MQQVADEAGLVRTFNVTGITIVFSPAPISSLNVTNTGTKPDRSL